MFFVAARKPTAERNKTYFTLYALNLPPLNSRVKNKTGFEFLFYYRFDSANQKQNIEENIVQVWFYETSIKILRLISKAPPYNFLEVMIIKVILNLTKIITVL